MRMKGKRINIDDSNRSDADMLEILTYSVHNYLDKIDLNTYTNFAVTRWMLCVIRHICKYESDHLDSDHLDSDHRKHVKNISKTLFHGLSEDELYITLEFGLSTLTLITIMVHLMLMNYL